MERVKRFFKDESAMTATEYGVMLGFLAILVATLLGAFWTELGNLFNRWALWFQAATVPAGPAAGS